MAKTVVPPKSIGELFEDLSALKLKIALLEKEEEELDHRDLVIKNDENLEQLAAQGEPRMLKHISRSYRKNQIKYATQRIVPQMIRVAASVLLFCYIGLTVAIAADSSVRIKVMEFIMNIEEKYTEFGFVDTGDFMDVPVEWQGYYYLADIPDDFAIKSVMRYVVHYENSNGVQLDFSDIDASASTAIDTEDANVEYISINGHKAMFIEKESWTSIIWSIDNRVLMINYTGESEDAIHMAESVRMIK